ncbi:MAG: hypothetical protein M5R42_17590 [Rhodocyclaceae bacterium]|nr:hypothetical protein [Rhodocyclaceae bacterium]
MMASWSAFDRPFELGLVHPQTEADVIEAAGHHRHVIDQRHQLEGRHRVLREEDAVGDAAFQDLIGFRGGLQQRHGADGLGDVDHHAAADADLLVGEVGQAGDLLLGHVDLAGAVRHQAEQDETLVLVQFGHVLHVGAPVGHRDRFGGIAEEGELGHLGHREAARRVAVHGERHIGEAIAHGVEGARRAGHGLRQQPRP